MTMARERYFQKPNGEHINEVVVAVIFDLSGDSVRAFSLDKKGTRRPGSSWTLREALQLVESGNWVELRLKDEPTSSAEMDTGPGERIHTRPARCLFRWAGRRAPSRQV